MAIVAADAHRWLRTSFLTLKFHKLFEVALWCCVFWFLVLSYTSCLRLRCYVVFNGFWSLYFFFPMLWGGGWDCSIARTIRTCSKVLSPTQSIVPYEYIPFPPLLGLLEGRKKCSCVVFTMVGAFWSLVFSRCLGRWATLDFGTDTPSMTS